MARSGAAFGRRKEPHTVIIARGDHIRHFTVRLWLVGFLGSGLAALAIGYLFATTYLVLRDDLIGAAAARQARMQQAYEDRISMLRNQVDMITSRQMLDQQLVQGKVAELLERQSQITQRHGQISPILERAKGGTDGLPDEAPVPSQRPGLRAAAASPVKAASAFNSLIGTSKQDHFKATTSANAYWSEEDDLQRITADDLVDEKKGDLFQSLDQSLQSIENEQILGLKTLATETYETADTIREALQAAGLPVDGGFSAEEDAVGGPLVSLDGDEVFEERVRELDDALARLDDLKDAARSYPIFNPAPGQSLSSPFGVRRDPFLRRPAMHAGLDFRTKAGTPVLAGGPGKVIRAGWNGGYGRMVEVQHEGGLSTRYAHLSRIDVKVGERVEVGQRVGAAGSTGRSTGPHLHYEVRYKGKATDPIKFLKTGRAIADLL